jgi:hypothetical protein
MILWFVFGLYWNYSGQAAGPHGWLGNSLFLFILLFMLGWHDFGFVVH